MSGRHWAELGETTFVGGTWLLYGVYRLLGRWPFRLCLYPVVFAYWLGSPVARRASLDYLRRLHAAEPGLFARRPGWRESLRHFACFAETLLDKMLAIGGRYPRARVRFEGHEAMLRSSQAGQGGIIATAHMGCLELMQMAAGWREGLRVTILVHTAHAQRFNRILERLNPAATVRLMQVTDFSPTTAMMLADRVAAGEFIAIAGDRVPVSGDRIARARFLGAPAELPAGPYMRVSGTGVVVEVAGQLLSGDIALEQGSNGTRFTASNVRMQLGDGNRALVRLTGGSADLTFGDFAVTVGGTTTTEFGIRGREVLLPAGAIIGHQLELFLQRLAGPNEPFPSFDDLPIPFRALATDIEHGSLHVIDHGSLPAALRASMSVPGIFAPAELDALFDYSYFTREVDKSFARIGLLPPGK